ncbi:MAG: magnesium chelatase subunit D [Rhodobacteraceae bacterium]|nr:magnesium chelatase subunit D [Paracoccaceae bacterium]
MSEHPAWVRARLALSLLAVDPCGLGGLWLRARPSPVRDRLVAALSALPLPLRRLHPAVADTQLYGGLDLAATLAAGRVLRTDGLLGTASALVLPMAERAPPGLAARLAQALDARAGHCLICLDEGAAEDEALAPALADRLAFRIDLDGIALAEAPEPVPEREAAAARGRLAAVRAPAEALADLARVAHRLGIGSLRAPLLALRAARGHAALHGRDMGPDDLRAAAELVLAPRATVLPETGAEAPPEPPPAPPEQGEGEGAAEAPRLPDEILLAAVKAALPPGALARLAEGRAVRAGGGSGSGATRKGNRRGRPAPPREGRPDGTQRIDLVATLRAAAPWQALRREAAPGREGLQVRPADFRTKRYEERSDRLIVFVVDASGSAALARLGEAKGAVELLLAEAYARRDHVALIAFRGTGAELLLPPTRSLVQTKRRLAALPGGGATPLAAGLKAALEVAEGARRRGMTPTAVLLTDGRANIALDGRADRTAAAEDAIALARALRASGVPALVIDMGLRPERALATLAQVLDAPYLPLPRADARRLSAAVSTALGG